MKKLTYIMAITLLIGFTLPSKQCFADPIVYYIVSVWDTGARSNGWLVDGIGTKGSIDAPPSAPRIGKIGVELYGTASSIYQIYDCYDWDVFCSYQPNAVSTGWPVATDLSSYNADCGYDPIMQRWVCACNYRTYDWRYVKHTYYYQGTYDGPHISNELSIYLPN